MEPKKIAVFQKELWVGGIQRSLINLLAKLDQEKYQVDLYLFDTKIFYETAFPPNVTVRFLKPFPYFYRLLYFSLVRRLAKNMDFDYEKKYDVAIDYSSFQHECAVGALGVKARKRVMWIHNDVEQTRKRELKYRLLWHFFKSKLRHYDAFAAVSGGAAEAFRRVSGMMDKPVAVIPNLIDTEEIYKKAAEPVELEVDPNCFNFCSVGRLCYQKGFDLLIRAFAAAAKDRGDLRLYIIGDGEDRKKLERLIVRLGVSDAVTILGYQPNPFPYMRRMDGFALTSHYEGQGMVLWEAKALGLPVLIPKRLEKYNEGIEGTDDIAGAMRAAVKTEKEPDPLDWYNQAITERIEALLQ